MNQPDYKYKRVPVVLETFSDLETPLSVYLKLADGPYSYLLESSQGGEKWGRYSIIGLPSKTILTVRGELIEVLDDGVVTESIKTEDPFQFIESFQNRYEIEHLAELPRFYGGLVGYFGYDAVRYVEKRIKESTPPDPIGTPDILLMVSEDIVVFDNVDNKIQYIKLVDPDIDNAIIDTKKELTERANSLSNKKIRQTSKTPSGTILESDFTSETGEQPFKDAVEKIKKYTVEGDVMQVVLAQRMSIPFDLPSIDLYRALRTLNPSPYMYFMNLKEFDIVSSSPEILARLEGGKITNRPLAGTRRRGKTEKEDQDLETELLNDPKEIAEHLMLIDLGRNDVGKVSEVGSVEVTEQFVIERYSHVMHISSNVEGNLQEGKSAYDLLKATLPVGTLSGAPKVRAMEIIDELEPVKRGIYGGAVGYISWSGNMDTAIAIRTAVIMDGRLYIQAGGGIVADSIPRLEWKESMNKCRAIFKAAELASSGFSDNSPNL